MKSDSLTYQRAADSFGLRYDNRNLNRGRWHNQLPEISLVYVSLAARLAGCQRGGRVFRSLVILLNVSPKTYSQIIRDKTISHGAFRVWHLLRDMLGNKNHCWPSYATICDMIGCSKSSLNGWIEELVKGEYITIKRGSRHASNRYFFSGIIPNHSSSKSNHTGIVSEPELNQHKLNQNNGGISPSERISLEKEFERNTTELLRIRGQASEDAWGRHYDDVSAARLRELKARNSQIQTALLVPL